MRAVGISRSPLFSPNSAERDAAIFSAVAEMLRAHGWDVQCVAEDALSQEPLSAGVVFSMARGTKALTLLSRAERTGTVVVNSPSSLLRMDRAALTLLFARHGVPQPENKVLLLTDAEVETPAVLPFPLWLKRGDACAQGRGDVVRVGRDVAVLRAALHDFRQRGIRSAVLSRHAVGDLVKFYGVEGTGFFFTSYPTQPGHFTKFGLERYNGAPHGYAFDAARLKALADHAARLTGFLVYGGDAVVGADGSMQLIDFNDWPSFGACRRDAAAAIAARIEAAAPGH